MANTKMSVDHDDDDDKRNNVHMKDTIYSPRNRRSSSSFSRFGVEHFRLQSEEDIVDEHGVNKIIPGMEPEETLVEEAADTIKEGFQISSFLTVMTLKLLKIVGFSWNAWLMFFRLVTFAVLLLPAFLRIVYKYFVSPDIFRDFYGPARRQSLDIYVLNRYGSNKKPVVIFFSGGAWIIGYKAWGALMGMCYSAAGYVFITPDYRNFPQQNIQGMVSDVNLAIDWCLLNIERYGGDKDNIVVTGQSAGAHLGSLAVLNAIARREKLDDVILPSEREILWDLDHIRGFIGISGPYNIVSLVPHLQVRGLNTGLLHMLFMYQEETYSPTFMAQRIQEKLKGRRLEYNIPILLVHGTADITVPYQQTQAFGDALRLLLQSEDSCNIEMMANLTHTDPIIELPMKGSDPLFARCLEFLMNMMPRPDVVDQDAFPIGKDPMLPISIINLARWCNPF